MPNAWSRSVFAAVFLVAPSVALAQPDAARPAAAGPPSDAASKGASPPRPDTTQTEPTCGPGDVSGVPPADAAAAVERVCSDVARAGSPGAYTVSLSPLGRVFLLRLSVKRPGAQIDDRVVRVSGVDDVPRASPPLVEALVRGQAISEKVAEEGKPHPLASGALRLSLGLMYVSTIEDFTGLTGAIVFARPRFDLFLDGRIGAGRDIDFWFSSVGVGGRFFFTVTDLAPFVGAGFGQTSVTIPNQGFTKGGSGGWPWLEAGVQFLRTRRVQLTLGVRADLPFSNMALSRGSYPDYRAQEGYRVPITFTATAGLFLGRLTMWRMTDDPGRHARPTALALALLSAPAVARGQADARPTPEPAAFTCGAGDLAGIPRTDAATAVDLVCRDVARVSRRPPGAYTVALTAVGRSVVLTLSLKHPSGRVEERSATLFGIEDVVTASPRVVGALVESQGMPEVKPSGEFGISVGPIVVNLPAAGALLVPGLTLGVAYEVRQAAAVFDLRLATHRNGALQAGYLALSAGGRYHFTRSDTAPFASAGLALAAVIEDYYYDQSEQTAFGGLAPWLEVGVTVFRTRRFQLAASVRANFPLGAMKGEDRRATPESERIITFRHYEVPITLASTFTF